MSRKCALTGRAPGFGHDVSHSQRKTPRRWDPNVERWRGTVESIAPASGSSFSLLPAQNTTGNWIKVVQRIPMRVRIDTPAGKPPLRAGMSVEVDVDTGHARGWPEFIAGWFGRGTAPGGETGKRRGCGSAWGWVRGGR